MDKNNNTFNFGFKKVLGNKFRQSEVKITKWFILILGSGMILYTLLLGVQVGCTNLIDAMPVYLYIQAII